MSYQLLTGDCLDVLPTLDANSIDAVVLTQRTPVWYVGVWKK